MFSNDDDIRLLRTDPGALIVRYQPVIRQMAEKYYEMGSFPASEVDDVVQSVNERLLRAAPSLAASFQGKSLFSTYMHAVVRNFLNREYRARKGAPRNLPFLDDLHGHEPAPGTSVDLAWHFRRFQAILAMYHRRRARVILGTKVFCGVPVTAWEVLEAYPACPGKHLLQFLGHFGEAAPIKGELEALKEAGALIARIEGKNPSADAYRRWVDLRINEILRLLNGDPPVYCFDRETLRNFLAHFFQYKGRK